MPDPASLALSGLALLVAIVSAVVTSRIANRQNQLQERLVTLETAREQDRLRQARSAEVRASIERDEQHFRERMVSRSPQYWLVIQNEGMAEARNVRVHLDGKPALEHALILRGESEITKMGPGVDYRYRLAVTMQSVRLLNVRIDWDDDSGKRRSWESELKVV